jgi:hypothetical protein
MRVSETYSNPPSANIFNEMACFLNLQNEVIHKYKFNKSAGNYIFLEMKSVECKNDLSLYNAYVNLLIEFKRRYKQKYNKEWQSKFLNIKNP